MKHTRRAALTALTAVLANWTIPLQGEIRFAEKKQRLALDITNLDRITLTRGDHTVAITGDELMEALRG